MNSLQQFLDSGTAESCLPSAEQMVQENMKLSVGVHTCNPNVGCSCKRTKSSKPPEDKEQDPVSKQNKNSDYRRVTSSNSTQKTTLNLQKLYIIYCLYEVEAY